MAGIWIVTVLIFKFCDEGNRQSCTVVVQPVLNWTCFFRLSNIEGN